MKVRRIATRDRREYLKQTLNRVAEDRQHGADADDIPRLLDELSSPDQDLRASALREICPCHMSWDVFLQLRKSVQLLRSDPYENIREIAYHIEEDASHLEQLEALRENLDEVDDDEEEYRRERKRELLQHQRRQVRAGKARTPF